LLSVDLPVSAVVNQKKYVKSYRNNGKLGEKHGRKAFFPKSSDVNHVHTEAPLRSFHEMRIARHCPKV
ncbi:MAG TPA: hypothetical protein VF287_06300, partial [Usitatibacter sp.]